MQRVFAILLFAASTAHAMTICVEPYFGEQPLAYDDPVYVTSVGQTVSVTRLDFLLSDFALRTSNGWVELTNQVAFIGGREGRTSFELNTSSIETFDRMRFRVGLSPEFNHADPAQYPSGHPLNPLVNGLHWGWMGGYVFFAIEGRWLRAGDTAGGYSYHIATDANLMTVELEQPIGEVLSLVLHVDRLFADTLAENNDSTHSRTNDTYAAQLARRVEQAFTAKVESREQKPLSSRGEGKQKYVGTPYRLKFSKFFPRPALPEDNPLTDEGVALGRELFFDKRLSGNGSQSCASCHEPEACFTEARPVSIGAEKKMGRRNAMGLFNLAWKSSFFWDGRTPTLREQVLQPIQHEDEMHESLSNVVAKLATPEDQDRFTRAFGDAEITADRIARALEQFLLTRISSDSKFDRLLARRDTLTEEEQRGFELFNTEYDPAHGQFGADCFHCHGGPLLQSQSFANNGLPAGTDRGRIEATGRAGDDGKFAVPSLRNVALTAPYMHDGRFETLEEAVAHYCAGVVASATLDPNLAKHPAGGVPLSESDQRALVAFLKTLTGEAVAAAAVSDR